MTNNINNQGGGNNIFFPQSDNLQTSSTTDSDKTIVNQTDEISQVQSSISTSVETKVPPIPQLSPEINNKIAVDSSKNQHPGVLQGAANATANLPMGYKNYLHVVATAIQNLQNQINNLISQINQSQSDQSGIQTANIDLNPILSSFESASNIDPKLADLILLRGRLNYIADSKKEVNSTADLKQYPELLQQLRDYGIQLPKGQTTLTDANLNNIINQLNKSITTQAQNSTQGILGQSLQSLLETTIDSVLPMVTQNNQTYALLHLENLLKMKGFTGKADNLAADQAILLANPDIVRELQQLGVLPKTPYGESFESFVKSLTSDQTGAIKTGLDNIIKSQVTAAPISAKQLVNLSLNNTQVQADALKGFLEAIKPFETFLKNYIEKLTSEIVNNSKLSIDQKQSILDLANGGVLATGLKGALNPGKAAQNVDDMNDSINILNNLEELSNNEKEVFAAADYKAQETAWLTRPLGYHHAHAGKIQKNPKYWSTAVQQLQSYAHNIFDVNMIAISPFVPGNLMKNLTVDDCQSCPQLFAYIEAHPELANVMVHYKEIIAADPLVKDQPGPFTSYVQHNIDGLTPDDFTSARMDELENLQTMLAMLKKLQAALQSGQIPQNLVKISSDTSIKIGISEQSLPLSTFA